MLRPRVLLVVLSIAWITAACSSGPGGPGTSAPPVTASNAPSSGTGVPSPSASPSPPPQARFSTSFDAGSAAVDLNGYSCTGLTGEWKVSLSVSGGGSGSGTTSFTPRRGNTGVPVTWSFPGQLEGVNGTWAGTARIYISGSQDAPRFHIGGTETFETASATSTGPAAGAARVIFGSVSACAG